MCSAFQELRDTLVQFGIAVVNTLAQPIQVTASDVNLPTEVWDVDGFVSQESVQLLDLFFCQRFYHSHSRLMVADGSV